MNMIMMRRWFATQNAHQHSTSRLSSVQVEVHKVAARAAGYLC